MPYLAAIALVALAFVVRLPLEPFLKGSAPYALFYLAVLACAWFWGVRSAITASLLSAAVVEQFLIPPGSPTAIPSLIPFGLACAGMVAMARAARDIKSRENRANAYLAAIVQSSDDAIISKDLNGIIQNCNPGCERIYGYKASELVGRPITVLIPEDRHAEEDDLLARLRAGERIEHFETKRRTRDGRLIDVSLTISPIRNAEGEIVGISKIARDITEARRAARELAAQQEWFRVTLSSIGDAVIATDVECNVVFMNPIAEQLTGWSGNEARGKSCETVFRIVNERTRRTVENPVRRVIESGMIVGLANHTVLIARDGQERPIDDSGAPIRNAEGDIVGVVLVFRDVSERQNAEREREAASRDRESLLEAERAARSEAERANRIKDDFMAMVSHELRTPLNAILGWTEVLTRTIKDPDAQRGLEVIGRNTRVQAQLISDLLDVSRIISGKLLLEVQSVDLSSVIEAAIDTVRLAADAKSITLRRKLDTTTTAMTGDPARLQQVMWNLLTNAIKFTPKGGTIDIQLRRSGSMMEIVVKDDGVGIRTEILDRVFERFHQQDGPTTRRHGGLGLGLSIVKQLVELHGGTVRAESGGEGKGATFTIDLPIAPTARPGLEPVQAMRVPLDGDGSLAGIEILVVDDEADTRDLIRRLVEGLGARVREAATSEQAEASMLERCPHILISDIGLPGVDGYELIQRVRRLAIDGVETMPAVALTAFARTDDRTRALLAGYQVHMAKPVEPAELVATLASFANLIRTRPGPTA